MSGGGDSLSQNRQGFTLGELVIAMVVITLVVCVTLPITLSKMKKVDYASYWMGYDILKNISSSFSSQMASAPNCDTGFAYGGANDEGLYWEVGCITDFFYPSPVSVVDGEGSHNAYGKGAANECKRRGGRLPRSEEAFALSTYISQMAFTIKINCASLKRRLDEVNSGNMGVVGGGSLEDLKASLEKEYNENCLSINYSDDLSREDLIEILYPGIKLFYDSRYSSYLITMYYSSPTDSDTFGSSKVNLLGEIITNVSVPYDQIQATCVVKDLKLCSFIRDNFNVGNDLVCLNINPNVFPDEELDLSKLSKVKLANGLIVYIGSDMVVIPDLADAINEDDSKGYVVYIDVNGDSGEGKLWEDVFPFYLLKSGKILAGYREDTPSGG